MHSTHWRGSGRQAPPALQTVFYSDKTLSTDSCPYLPRLPPCLAAWCFLFNISPGGKREKRAELPTAGGRNLYLPQLLSLPLPGRRRNLLGRQAGSLARLFSPSIMWCLFGRTLKALRKQHCRLPLPCYCAFCLTFGTQHLPFTSPPPQEGQDPIPFLYTGWEELGDLSILT